MGERAWRRQPYHGHHRQRFAALALKPRRRVADVMAGIQVGAVPRPVDAPILPTPQAAPAPMVRLDAGAGLLPGVLGV
jgi:hypothetical protein